MSKYRKSRRERKKQKKMIFFGMIGLVCLFSIGYASFSSEFLISGTGTIISEPVTLDKLKEKVVTSGDGLYVDPVETGRYVYRGADPDNYINLAGDVYRIIALESDGTLKVIKNDSIGTMYFDPGYATSISGITSANSVSGTRYSNVSTDYCYYNGVESDYKGCNVWGSKTTMLDENGNNVTKMPVTSGATLTYDLPETESYINTYLNTTFYNGLSSEIKENLVEHYFNVGSVKPQSGQSLENDVLQEKAYKWKGNIGLMNATDYVRASTNELCATVHLNRDIACYGSDENHNYLFNSDMEWTLTPRSTSSKQIGIVFHIWENTRLLDSGDSRYMGIVSPDFYLLSDIRLSGSGTKNDMYMIF